MNRVFLYMGISILLLCSVENSAQSNLNPYFPMQIGNRWDYFVTNQIHGGYFLYDTLSVKIVADTLIDSKIYFVFSEIINWDFNDDWKFLRINNDSLFCYSSEDSADCMIFAFNQIVNNYYDCCRYDYACFYDETFLPYFGKADSQQYHQGYDTFFEFSANYGILHMYKVYPLQEIEFSVTGCIIAGQTYGNLLTVNEKSRDKNLTIRLDQNYPNPFNPETVISFEIPKRTTISLFIYDLLGREVENLIKDEIKDAGRYEVIFNGTNFPSGIYLYSLRAGSNIKTGKMILLK